MMKHSNSSTGSNSNSNSNGDLTDKNSGFGSLLAEARKANNYTIDEISEHLKIPARTITALETNDKSALPAATFVQGYIRAYAKFLEISEDEVLASYNQTVTHDAISDLKPRSKLPDETNSQSPLIKTITAGLIVAGIATIGFGSFQYYQKKAGVLESELDNKQQSFTGSSLDSPGENSFSARQNTGQNTGSNDDDELIVDKPGAFEYVSEKSRTEKNGIEESVAEKTSVEGISAEKPKAENARVEDIRIERVRTEDTRAKETSKAEANNSGMSRFEGAIAESGESTETNNGNKSDIIEIIAENGSWVEVRDANKSRLLYNMLPVGGSKVLVGQAPFSISMGNARTTRVIVNDLEIDVTAYIRSSNTASFKVSTEGKNIIFH